MNHFFIAFRPLLEFFGQPVSEMKKKVIESLETVKRLLWQSLTTYTVFVILTVNLEITKAELEKIQKHNLAGIYLRLPDITFCTQVKTNITSRMKHT